MPDPAEFPYPDYLGHWRDTVSGIDWQFNQSELSIGFQARYKSWKVRNDTLLLSNTPNVTERRMYVEKSPYLTPKYEWKMILNEGAKHYLKKQ